ncbi:hypothetical protein DMX07_06805 [Pseudomonas soli]|uniref:Uncharacterized protein n=1 Tax=Pseudomonas soli TaxID=1306993 RepID=A0A2V4ISY5_9PSED|nr:hypothetical protein DMX07_06805 [Pseudomonas soli]
MVAGQPVETRMPRGPAQRIATITSKTGPFEAGRDKVRRTHRGHPTPSAIAITSAHWNNCQV